MSAFPILYSCAPSCARAAKHPLRPRPNRSIVCLFIIARSPPILLRAAVSDTARRSSRRVLCNSSCVPSSTMRPCSSTTIRSAFFTVDTRCEIRMVVRSRISTDKAAQDSLFGDGINTRQRIVQNQDPADREESRAQSRFAASGRRRESGPRSPITVSSPFGKRCDVGPEPGQFRRPSIVSRVASGTPQAMFSARVALNKNVSCGTKPIWRRSSSGSNSPQIDAAQFDAAARSDRTAAESG